MMKNKIFGKIYSVLNRVTGEYYIGATKKSIEERKTDHIKRAKSEGKGRFQEAIATYGIEAFQWSEIDTANNTNELAEKEKQYIIRYNSKEKGYNEDQGGGFKKIIFQYELVSGLLIKKHEGLKAAAELLRVDIRQLSRACLSINKIFKGFYWSYIYKEPFKPKTDNRNKMVQQIDVSGNTINEFKSISEASIVTGINKTSIAKVCRRERYYAGGYQWTFK